MKKAIKCLGVFEQPGGNLTMQITFDHLTTSQCKYLCDAVNTIKLPLEIAIKLILHTLVSKEDQQALDAYSSPAPTIDGNAKDGSNEICLPFPITKVSIEKWNSTLGTFSANLSSLVIGVLQSFVNSTTTSALPSTTAPTITSKSSSTINTSTTTSNFTTTKSGSSISSTTKSATYLYLTTVSWISNKYQILSVFVIFVEFEEFIIS